MTKKIYKITSITTQVILLGILLFTVFTFAASKIALFGSIKSMVVLTGSMEPTLPVGSVVFIKKQIAYNKKDIITFTSGGQNITHRITDVLFGENGTTYTTQGDANNVADGNPVFLEKVSGRVFFSIPYIGKIIGFLNKPHGFLAFVIFPTLIFVGFELWNIKKEIELQTERKVMERLNHQSQISLDRAMTLTQV